MSGKELPLHFYRNVPCWNIFPALGRNGSVVYIEMQFMTLATSNGHKHTPFMLGIYFHFGYILLYSKERCRIVEYSRGEFGMPENSRALGDAVKRARIQQGLSKKQLADIIDVDVRTITNIENYESNTTLHVLYRLLNTLKIDSRVVFCTEKKQESQLHFQLKPFIEECTEEEVAALIPVCESVTRVLRTKKGSMIEE